MGLIGAGAGIAAAPLWAQSLVDLHLPGGPSGRPIATGFPGKGPMVLQRSRGPLLETPFAAYDGQVFTPNDRFFVRWHYADIPTAVDVHAFRLKVLGAVKAPLELSLADLLGMDRVEIAAVNQCSGNSRGFFAPRVPGGQWGNGAMGNARWTGVRLKDVLDKAGVAPGAVQVKLSGLDRPPGEAPAFAKSLDVAHAMDGEVMIAFQMNGEQLPMLNGFPIRMVVPGWYSTYWVKALDRIEVLDKHDTGFWMDKAYLIPKTPRANVVPGAKGFPTEPINRMVPRSFVTNLADGARVAAGKRFVARGLAFGGAHGVKAVELSLDNGRHWYPAALGADEGRYSFRLWEIAAKAPTAGAYHLAVRCTNDAGETQMFDPIWNPGGFMRNPIERVALVSA
ncbi:MAG: molybdopterin-dependent oxidoreductase [Pseudomonadota bacterium]|nr:molybdopterin-dependent oxidoreductase [Pseudomonadota bacterium]